MNLKQHIRTIPDFPEKGIMFRDVTTLFSNAKAFEEMVNQFAILWSKEKIDVIAGIDARGFIIGGALAYKLKLPFVAIRKAGKLPDETISEEYDLEYGKATLEVHKDAFQPGASVLVIDDLIATGGTAVASVNLVRAIGGKVSGCGFLIDLPDLGGGQKLEGMGVKVKSLMAFYGQ
jgi:adenine phosphoribosyltransferase